ncbi:MAG: PilZ domain-containing protein [SAR324 cluster bacterium]|nr:PilZ domain-containing protein [SAR324 cluster bacterium]
MINSDKTRDQRKEPRHIYRHRLSITMHRHFTRGEVVDWSRHGLQAFIIISTDINLHNARIRFHVEKYKGLQGTPELWSREGTVRWSESQDDGWNIGIQLDQPIDDLPMDDIENFITEEDFCYLFFLSETDDTGYFIF